MNEYIGIFAFIFLIYKITIVNLQRLLLMIIWFPDLAPNTGMNSKLEAIWTATEVTR